MNRRPKREQIPLSALIALQFALLMNAEWGRVEVARVDRLDATDPPETQSSNDQALDDWTPPSESPRLALTLAERTLVPLLEPVDPSWRVREGVSGWLRERDDALGLNAPEVPGVARVVADVARQSGAPHGAKATFAIELAPDGTPRAVTRDAASQAERSWLAASAEIDARLRASPVAMGREAHRAGAVVHVEVEMLHVYPHQTSWQLKLVADCSDVPTIQHVDEHERPLSQMFPFCLRFDTGSWGSDKQLVVHTRAGRQLADFEK